MKVREAGNIVDVLNSAIYPGIIEIRDGKIEKIVRTAERYNTFIIPPLVDSHVHIESSLLIPSEFARLAVRHGTVAAVSDPHEIANILGTEGINYMIENSGKVSFKIYFGAPSCVPATSFETSGGELGPVETEALLKRDEIKFLGEVMNYRGVIEGEGDIAQKIELAKKYKKPIDGHGPGLRGKSLAKYAGAGITTDHETTELAEGIDKIKAGIKIIIREGSAAKNFDALVPLIRHYPDYCMFSSDDKHPDDLVKGHINDLVKRAVKQDYDIMSVLKAASINPVKHYGLEVGLLQEGDFADFVVTDNFKDFNILKTYINGKVVAEEGKTLIQSVDMAPVNNFKARMKRIEDFVVKKAGDVINIIGAIDGQIITERLKYRPTTITGYAVSNTERDILKIAVVNRYSDAPPAVGFIKNFGLRKGAIATSVAHDSHNIVVVGASDAFIQKAVNTIVEHKGGLVVTSDTIHKVLPLPVAGIMSNEEAFKVVEDYNVIERLAKELGTELKAPFMTLSFMSLLVIPKLKLSDKGLFDSERFEFIRLFE